MKILRRRELIARVRRFRAELGRLWGAVGDAAAVRLATAERNLAASARQAARDTRRSVDAEQAGLRRAAQALARQSRLAASTSHADIEICLSKPPQSLLRIPNSAGCIAPATNVGST